MPKRTTKPGWHSPGRSSGKIKKPDDPKDFAWYQATTAQLEQSPSYRRERSRDDVLASGIREVADYLGLSGAKAEKFCLELRGAMDWYWHSLDRSQAGPPRPSEVKTELDELDATISRLTRQLDLLSESAKAALFSIIATAATKLTSVGFIENPLSPNGSFKANLRMVRYLVAAAAAEIAKDVGPGQPKDDTQEFIVHRLIDMHIEWNGGHPIRKDMIASNVREKMRGLEGDHSDCRAFIEAANESLKLDLDQNAISNRINTWFQHH